MNESWSYPSIIGMLLYLSCNSQPNIAFAVSDHQESEENIEIEELSGEEPGVPSKESETYEPLDPPDNESDAGDVESGPSNLDAEQEEELMRSKPRRSTR